MKFNVVPRREIRIWKMSSPRTAWCKSRFTSIVDDYQNDNGDDKTIVNLQVHRQNTQHRRWYGRERTQRCKGLNVHVQNMWFFLKKNPYSVSSCLKTRFQLKRSKEKKEELKRETGGTELIDLSWDVYYKKVTSMP